MFFRIVPFESISHLIVFSTTKGDKRQE